MNRYKKLLIPVVEELDCLRQGLEMALEEHCLVTVLRIFPPYEGELDLTGVRDIARVISSNRDQEMAAIKEVIQEEGALARVMVAEGEAASVIKRVAQEEGCDLIFLAQKKSRNPFSRLMTDNLAKKVINLAACPVWVAQA